MTSLPTKWKMGKCLEWYTQLPLKDQPLTSPVFLIQNVECFFYFCRIYKFNARAVGSYYYDVYLKANASNTEELKSFSFTIYINYDGVSGYPPTLKTATFSSCDKCVLTFPDSYYTKQAVNLDVGFNMKYLFVFEDGVGLILPSETVKENKSIQTGSYLNANVSVESLPDDFSKLLKSGLLHDAEIKCGKHSLKVHKSVLCARSEVFKRMLQSDFLEGQTAFVQIQDMDACYFQHFMQYLYTGSMPELTFEEAKALYEVGDKYAIRSLMLRCSEYLQDSLSKENAFECFLLGDAHSDEKLQEAVKAFILEKEVYLEEEYFALFCEKFPKMAAQVCSLAYRKRKSEE